MYRLLIMSTRKKLFSIKDFEVQTFRSGGPGGQNQNKRNTGVRIIHKSSGAREESREARTQEQNKKLAFQKLSKNKKFLSWINSKVNNIEEAVEKEMSPENIKIEVLENDEWVECDF